jgi:Zn-dependent peptidase ImmA (M78 family)
MARRADLAAARLLIEHPAVRPPVDVDELAASLGVSVVLRTFADADVSGMLFRGERDVIGVNSAHSPVRQRFTIAHELGHRALHPGRELILDAPVRVNFRDRTSSTATDREEIEANAFAAALLMPESMVRAELERLPPNVRRDLDETTSRLADRFDVSTAALGFRLINLGLTS